MASERPTLPPEGVTLESVYRMQVQQSEQVASLIMAVHALTAEVSKLRGAPRSNGHDPILDRQPTQA